jgi:hypothetical protein
MISTTAGPEQLECFAKHPLQLLGLGDADAFAGERFAHTANAAKSSSSAVASFRPLLSKPSVNQS